ncbi:MAG: amino acid permease [Thermoanaerobaculia bacterium]|nr:amino acid permease [Thermoanaerobaculia bacterium]
MRILRKSERLPKELTLFHVFAVSTGAMFSSGFFLLPGLAAAMTGSSVVLAYFLAGLLMVPAMLSKAELATAMPRAGGTYYFLDRSLGPMVGTVGGIGTWIVMALKSAFALIGMGAYLGLVMDLPIKPVAIGLTIAFGVLNIVGVKQTVGLQAVLTLIVLAVLALFIGEGVWDVVQHGESKKLFAERFTPFLDHGIDGLLATVGFVVVSFAGLTKVASVAEEVKDPERNIPMGMILSLVTATSLYVVGISLMIFFLPPDQLRGDLTPVASAARVFFDWLPGGVGFGLIVVAAIAGFAAAGNAAMMSASRYPLAMARDQLMPPLFARLSPRFKTPIPAVLVTSGLMIGFIALLSVPSLAKLASSVQLLVFGLVSLAVIVMRESRIDSYDPGFRSPWYPWMQLAGIGVSLWLIVEIGLLSMLFTVTLIGVAIVWYFIYARHRVHRGGALFHVFARLGKQRFEGLDPELRSIMKEKGLRAQDPFDEVVARAFVIESPTNATFEDLMREASKRLAERAGAPTEEIEAGLLDGARMGATPVSRGAALPHVHVKGIEHPEMVLIRVRDGLDMKRSDTGASSKVFAVFVLASPDANPSQHLRLLAETAGRVDDDDFLEDWLGATHEAKLKEVLLRDERFVRLLLNEESPAASWIGKTVRALQLPHGCLIALLRREVIGTVVPDGNTVILLGDRLTIIGEPSGIRQLERSLEAIEGAK